MKNKLKKSTIIVLAISYRNAGCIVIQWQKDVMIKCYRLPDYEYVSNDKESLHLQWQQSLPWL